MNWPWKRRQIVLGTELAKALTAEEKRIASGISGPSPLPPGEYEVETGDFDLVSVSPSRFDLSLRAFMEEIGHQDPAQLQKIRHALSFDDLYTLIHFAKRSSVLALNNNPVEWCRAGLVALSLIDEARVDVRDARWALGFLEFSVIRAGIKDRLADSDGSTSPFITTFLRHLPATHQLQEWGYSEIRTAQGVGLIEQGFANYAPTADLTAIALLIAEELTNDRYVGRVQIAADLPEIWFEKQMRANVRVRLNHCLGVAAIHGTLREGYRDNGSQMFVEWVAEMPTAEDCSFLLRAVGSGKPLSARYSVGVSEGRLFALLVAGSAQQGVAPFESLESLSELAMVTRRILQRFENR